MSPAGGGTRRWRPSQRRPCCAGGGRDHLRWLTPSLLSRLNGSARSRHWGNGPAVQRLWLGCLPKALSDCLTVDSAPTAGSTSGRGSSVRREKPRHLLQQGQQFPAPGLPSTRGLAKSPRVGAHKYETVGQPQSAAFGLIIKACISSVKRRQRAVLARFGRRLPQQISTSVSASGLGFCQTRNPGAYRYSEQLEPLEGAG